MRAIPSRDSPFRSCFRRCRWGNSPKPPSQCVPWSGRECLGTPSAAWDSVQRRSLQPNSRWGPAKAAGERYKSPWDPDDLASTNFQASIRRLNNKGQVSNNFIGARCHTIDLVFAITSSRALLAQRDCVFSLWLWLTNHHVRLMHTNLANLSPL